MTKLHLQMENLRNDLLSKVVEIEENNRIDKITKEKLIQFLYGTASKADNIKEEYEYKAYQISNLL